MLEFRRMTKDNKDDVVNMAKIFYNSDAVSHNVSEEVLLRTFNDAFSDNSLLDGFMLINDDKVIGYAYITTLYACECGGEAVLLEELFISEKSRGKGFGKEFFKWLFKLYPEAVRFRLEVTKDNKRAYNLYKSLGFDQISYLQMVYDVEV